MELSGNTILESIKRQCNYPVERVVLKRTLTQGESRETVASYTRIEESNTHETFEIDNRELLVIVNMGSAKQAVKDVVEDIERHLKQRVLDLRGNALGWHVLPGGKMVEY